MAKVELRILHFVVLLLLLPRLVEMNRIAFSPCHCAQLSKFQLYGSLWGSGPSFMVSIHSLAAKQNMFIRVTPSSG